MDEMASQIISVSIVYSTVRSDAERQHQSSASLAFVRGRLNRKQWACTMLIGYILIVCLRSSPFSQLSLMPHIWVYAFSPHPFVFLWMWEYMCFIILSLSFEILIITHGLGLDDNTVVSATCFILILIWQWHKITLKPTNIPILLLECGVRNILWIQSQYNGSLYVARSSVFMVFMVNDKNVFDCH